MKVIARSVDGRHVLVETEAGKGYIEDTTINLRTAEKSIVALLSANIEWADDEETGAD